MMSRKRVEEEITRRPWYEITSEGAHDRVNLRWRESNHRGGELAARNRACRERTQHHRAPPLPHPRLPPLLQDSFGNTEHLL